MKSDYSVKVRGNLPQRTQRIEPYSIESIIPLRPLCPSVVIIPSLFRELNGSDKTPTQKRVFHLVYGRSNFSGGASPDESDHLKNQVLAFAKDLHRITKEFAQSVEEEPRALIEVALQNALNDAKTLAEKYGITNPLEES